MQVPKPLDSRDPKKPGSVCCSISWQQEIGRRFVEMQMIARRRDGWNSEQEVHVWLVLLLSEADYSLNSKGFVASYKRRGILVFFCLSGFVTTRVGPTPKARHRKSQGLLSPVELQQGKYDVPDAAKTWVLKTIGHSYKEEMKNYKPQDDESDVVDPYMVMMHKENDGYRRLYGRGVTNRLIKKVGGGDTSYMIPEALMESFKSNEVERNQLIEMKKEIQEDHEKKKAELEAMQIDINNQREKFEKMIREFREQQALEGRSF
ncbi:hypothetical protein LXL04_034142 [Taraxacum kok-saghyz]